jgi:hypothetical protein
VEVVDHQPHGWFLLRDGERYFLDVNCHLPFVDISILVELDDEERTEHRALGRTFVEYLAAKVSHWPDRYRSRDITGPLAQAAQQAIERSSG